ncbi:MAG TPA: TIGR03620 family F420-dependent LLM class oxidoreductase [Acidimicrobiales bacterium]|nr:TIGR03620 family F420-dependent LLM class oxidoreductase [Acidimicrobiales bacterium]
MPALGRVGIWTRQLDTQPASQAQDAVAELEALGYPTVWIPEAVEREVISHAALLLSASSTIIVATGIANIYARAPRTIALAQLLLAERFEGRFLLGLGVSHPAVVERRLHQSYERPVEAMRSYLKALDHELSAPHPAPPRTTPSRVLAALGPRMVSLAAERSAGAHTYLAPAAHTAWARDLLGESALLAPAVKVVLDRDASRAREVARTSVGPILRVPAYRENLRRVGFSDGDVEGGPSDRLVDALVAVGDIDAVMTRLKEHLDAGADHVCVEVLTGDDTTVPRQQWSELAPALKEL